MAVGESGNDGVGAPNRAIVDVKGVTGNAIDQLQRTVGKIVSAGYGSNEDATSKNVQTVWESVELQTVNIILFS